MLSALPPLRTGGATALFEDCQSLDPVAWRGRWATRRTLEVYIQEIGPAALLAEASADARYRIDRFAAALPSLLDSYSAPSSLSARHD